MKPMEPMGAGDPWWPADLGEPSTSGGQNDFRYAYFAETHRLSIDSGGVTTTYDTGDHRIGGVSQESGGSEPTFSSQHGTVRLGELKRVG